MTKRKHGSTFAYMPNTHSHVSDTESPRRAYAGEDGSKRLVDWLNEKPMTKPQLRVLEILRLYNDLCQQWKITRNAKRKSDATEMRAVRTGSDKDYYDRMNELQRRLRHYTYFPMILPIGPIEQVHWCPASNAKKYSHGWSIDYDDKWAVMDLARIAEIGLLGRLRECTCGRWIWARFSHQQHCSSKCREKYFRSSESWKAHRREKAREYYWLRKNKNVK